MSGLKTVAVPFNVTSLRKHDKRGYLWAWYQELPLSWYYMDLFPYPMFDFAAYAACNLRFPFQFHLTDATPIRDSLASLKPEKKECLLSRFKDVAYEISAEGFSSEEENCVLATYCAMKSLCDEHGIRFVVIKAPLLPIFAEALSYEYKQSILAFEDKLKAQGIELIAVDVPMDESFFFDYIHMVEPGSVMYTEAVVQLIK